MTREITNLLIENVEEGLLDWEAIARAALSYMSEDEVADMARANELLPYDEDEYEDDGQPDELTEWMDFDPDC